jgi:hypothetical protein
MAQSLLLNSAWTDRGKEPAVNVAQPTEPNTVLQSTSPDSLLLSLAPSFSFVPLAATTPLENPTAQLQYTQSSGAREVPSPTSMAYQCVDPRPFIPNTFQWVEFMCRVLAPLRPLATNEDLAIVTFDPLPGNVLNFAVVRNIVRDCLLGHWVVPRAVLPCHLGQAYVRFTHAYERDNMVRQSPMNFGNIQISFVKHNEGHNWRRVFSMKNAG